MASDRLQELVSRRTFHSTWAGSHHAYDACLLSFKPELIPEAISQLRLAREWMQTLWKLDPEERHHEEISENDLAELAMAVLNSRGATACANYLRSWHPHSISFDVGRKLARRLVDHARFSELESLYCAREFAVARLGDHS
jgi:hypothetical protein